MTCALSTEVNPLLAWVTLTRPDRKLMVTPTGSGGRLGEKLISGGPRVRLTACRATPPSSGTVPLITAVSPLPSRSTYCWRHHSLILSQEMAQTTSQPWVTVRPCISARIVLTGDAASRVRAGLPWIMAGFGGAGCDAGTVCGFWPG